MIFTNFYSDCVEHVLAGRWKFGEDYIRHSVRKNLKMIQSLIREVIRLDAEDFKEGEIHGASVDCVNFKCNEFRCNPSTIWYDYKSNSSGMVDNVLAFNFSWHILVVQQWFCFAGLKYQFAMALRRVSIFL